MSESSTHRCLVAALIRFVTTMYLHGEERAVLVDSATPGAFQRPPSINGCVPDVYVPRALGGRLIVGEAKTKNDLESRHTFAQLEALLSGCLSHDGGLFILAVPWDAIALARHLLRDLMTGLDVGTAEVKVLDPIAFFLGGA